MKIVKSRAATADLRAIYRYFEAYNPYAAARIIAAVDAKFRVIAEQPRIGRERPEFGAGVRSFVSGNHVILYAIDGAKIVILRVVDGRMDLDAEFSP
jgi:toxin ParE1/3/4